MSTSDYDNEELQYTSYHTRVILSTRGFENVKLKAHLVASRLVDKCFGWYRPHGSLNILVIPSTMHGGPYTNIYSTSTPTKPSQGHVKYVIGCWTRPTTASVYTKGKKNVKVTMEFKVPKTHYFRSILFIDMVQWILRWERQKNVLMQKKARCHGKNLI